MVFNKNNKKEITAIEDLIRARVYVNPKRFEELSKLKEDIWTRPLETTQNECTLLCFNVSSELEIRLQSVEGYALQVSCFDATRSGSACEQLSLQATNLPLFGTPCI